MPQDHSSEWLGKKFIGLFPEIRGRVKSHWLLIRAHGLMLSEREHTRFTKRLQVDITILGCGILKVLQEAPMLPQNGLCKLKTELTKARQDSRAMRNNREPSEV